MDQPFRPFRHRCGLGALQHVTQSHLPFQYHISHCAAVVHCLPGWTAPKWRVDLHSAGAYSAYAHCRYSQNQRAGETGRVLLSTLAETGSAVVLNPVEPTELSPALVACVGAVTATGFGNSSVATLTSVRAEYCFFSEDCSTGTDVSS